jgi:16S rRNA (cytosine967-C5)-methyltransferase
MGISPAARMAEMFVSPARAAAYEILLRVERETSYASDLLNAPAYAHLSGRDHALATELVLGVLRWRSRLDEELAKASLQPLSRVDVEILIALRMGLYQLRCLDRIPSRAALYESVELVKLARKRSAASFVNAVLRKVAAKVESYENFLPSNNAPTPESIACALAHPRWLVERWTHEYGAHAVAKICEYNQSVPPTAIRLRTPSAEHELAQECITLKPAKLLSLARIVLNGDVTHTQAHRGRHVVIQDQASQLVAALMASPQVRTASRPRILDCCAAPGGKTLAIADGNPEAAIIAVELHPHRARLLQRLVRGAETQDNIRVIVGDAGRLPLTSSFDRVLVDVPCSGTGTLARNPEIKWRLQPSDLKDLQARQIAILQSAMAHVAPGGRIVYSTCSMEKEENEDVVEHALAGNEGFRVLDCRVELDRLKKAGQLVWPDVASLTRGPYLRTIPGIHPCDGFFAAVLEKI